MFPQIKKNFIKKFPFLESHMTCLHNHPLPTSLSNQLSNLINPSYLPSKSSIFGNPIPQVTWSAYLIYTICQSNLWPPYLIYDLFRNSVATQIGIRRGGRPGDPFPTLAHPPRYVLMGGKCPEKPSDGRKWCFPRLVILPEPFLMGGNCCGPTPDLQIWSDHQKKPLTILGTQGVSIDPGPPLCDIGGEATYVLIGVDSHFCNSFSVSYSHF